jgi:hypothetical protein
MRTLSLLLGATAGSQLCPSDECWDFNAGTGECTIKPDQQCITLTCNHDSMVLNFGANFYGVGDGAISEFESKFGTTWDAATSRFTIDCPLGGCDMAVETNADGSVLKYSMQVATHGSNMIQVAGLTLYNRPAAATLDASCEYSTSVSIASDQMEVIAATADANLHKAGDLSDGFHLNLYSESTRTNEIVDTVFIGQRIWAQVEWDVISAQTQVNYYVNNCNVHLDDTPDVVASIVEGNCYSSALGVTKLGSSWIVADNSAFTFSSFSSNGHSAQSQQVTVKCDVKLCLLSDNKCTINTVQNQCPRIGSGYVFTPNGCTNAYNNQDDGTCTAPQG